MLKVTAREGETFASVKERMWKVVKLVSALKTPVAEHTYCRGGRAIWTSFVKTRNARARSSHVSIDPSCYHGAFERPVHHCEGPFRGGDRPMRAYQTSFDCDWSLGTIWCGIEKLGSATHRQPKGEEIITMGAGWISVTAVCPYCRLQYGRRQTGIREGALTGGDFHPRGFT